jgi:hypothetical protein
MSAAQPPPLPKAGVTFPKASDVKFRLTPEDVAELNQLTRNNFQSKEEILQHARRMGTISVEGVEITLDPALLKRLETRRQGPMDEYLRLLIRKQLESFVGM